MFQGNLLNVSMVNLSLLKWIPNLKSNFCIQKQKNILRCKVPQYNLGITLILNFHHVSFLAFFNISLELGHRNESLRQRNN